MILAASQLRIARQPILDRKGSVFGYELLYRSKFADSAAGADSRAMSMGSLEAIVEMGLDNIVGSAKAFYNIDFEVLDLTIFDTIPKDRIVLEILEGTQPTKENIDKARDLRSRGFTLAIDDYEFQSHLEPFLPYVEFVKLECAALTPNKDFKKISSIAQMGKMLLAEKLEDMASYTAYSRIGCHFFQGYYFAKPVLVEGTAIRSNKTALINFLAKVNQEDVSIRELEEIIASDPTIAYKLLRHVQSAAYAAPHVETVGQAIMYLGLKPTAALAAVLALSADDDRPNELLVVSLTRAKMCEALARSAGLPQPDGFFTAGLLSTLDAYLNLSMEQITEFLPLSDELKGALVGDSTGDPFLAALSCVRACEVGDFLKADSCGFDPDVVQSAYHSAIRWADEMNKSLSTP